MIFGYRNDNNSHADTWAHMDEEVWDFYIEQQRKVVYAFYESWRKKLQIENLNTFLSKCYGIDKIVVLGHSMSAVDSEYMEQIERTLCPVNWEISYYNIDDIERIQLQGYSFQNKIKFAKLEDLLEKCPCSLPIC